MPIRREHRGFYPIDWPQLTDLIRFRRAGGRCEGCGRPHLERVACLQDGRWFDTATDTWRDGRGRILRSRMLLENLLYKVRFTRVVLATAHRNHDTSDNAPGNLAALCQRCHMIHDRPEHQRRRRFTLFSRKAAGDLFLGPYPWV
ncbi:hypothetical protein [Methylobacterium sp. WSM2598]|uniref:hypothetical protein n=1 Tax=Methylobacterium sp. WSM2598 TaxID=398261 RepID=UPI0003818DA9|nr:hypothetical protein [Methylobacterium sp. WSM2598]